MTKAWAWKVSHKPLVCFFSPITLVGIRLSNKSCKCSCLIHSGFNAKENPLSQGPSQSRPASHSQSLGKGSEPYGCLAAWTALPALAISAGN